MSKKYLEQLETLAVMVRERNKIGTLLLKDIEICANAFQKGVDDYLLNQFWRRTLVRNLFSAIEGMTHQYKQLAKQIADCSLIEFSSAEIALLNEETYILNNKGEADVQKSKLRTADNLLFSLNMLAKSCKSKFVINKGGAEWQAFLKAQKVRDRIMHPKKFEDVEITDDEMPLILETGSWFMFQVNAPAIKLFSDFFDEFSKSQR